MNSSQLERKPQETLQEWVERVMDSEDEIEYLIRALGKPCPVLDLPNS